MFESRPGDDTNVQNLFFRVRADSWPDVTCCLSSSIGDLEIVRTAPQPFMTVPC